MRGLDRRRAAMALAVLVGLIVCSLGLWRPSEVLAAPDGSTTHNAVPDISLRVSPTVDVKQPAAVAAKWIHWHAVGVAAALTAAALMWALVARGGQSLSVHPVALSWHRRGPPLRHAV